MDHVQLLMALGAHDSDIRFASRFANLEAAYKAAEEESWMVWLHATHILHTKKLGDPEHRRFVGFLLRVTRQFAAPRWEEPAVKFIKPRLAILDGYAAGETLSEEELAKADINRSKISLRQAVHHPVRSAMGIYEFIAKKDALHACSVGNYAIRYDHLKEDCQNMKQMILDEYPEPPAF